MFVATAAAAADQNEKEIKKPPLREVEYIQLRILNSRNIKDMSVMEILKPEDFESNKLGSSDLEKACESCENIHCTCHCAYITLGIPVFNCLFNTTLMRILNSVCFFCQSLRIPVTDSNYQHILHVKSEERLEFVSYISHRYSHCWQCKRRHIQFKKEDTYNTVLLGHVLVTDEDLKKPTSDWLQITPWYIYRCLQLIDKELWPYLNCSEYNTPDACMFELFPVPARNAWPNHYFGGLGGSRKKFANDWYKYLRAIFGANKKLQEAMLQHKNSKNSHMDYSHWDLNLAMYTDGHGMYSRFPDHIVTWKQQNELMKLHYLSKHQEKGTSNLATKAKKTYTKFQLDQWKLADTQRLKNNMGTLFKHWRELQYQIAAFHSKKHKKFIKASAYSCNLDNLDGRYQGQKKGRFRGNGTAKRVDNTGRFVLEGFIQYKIDQVCLPISGAMILCFDEPVHAYNKLKLQKLILNGPFQYPGCRYLVMKNGQEINLANYENRRNIDIDQVAIVKRHIMDGDYILVGRQPTLHRLSMMSYRVIVTREHVLRIHYANFKGKAADCDGDELHVFIPSNYIAKAELQCICSPQNNIMKDGKVWIGFIQTAILGAYLLTLPNQFFDLDDLSYLVGPLDYLWSFPEPAIVKPKALWTGKQIASLLLPKDFHIDELPVEVPIDDPESYQKIKQMILDNTSKEGPLVVHRGELLNGILDAKHLNDIGGIIHYMYRQYHDKNITADFIYYGYQLFQQFMSIHGASASFHDYAVFPQKAPLPEIRVKLEQNQVLFDQLADYCEQFRYHTPDNDKEIQIERNIDTHISKLGKAVQTSVYDYHKSLDYNHFNGMLLMIESGTKGSPEMMSQLGGMIGQAKVKGKRFESRLSYFNARNHHLISYGFINRSYAEGVGLVGLMAESPGTSETINEKNRGTSKMGYCMRKVTSCMMSIVADFKGRVMDTHNQRIIWFTYGSDGFEAQILASTNIRWASCSELTLIERYGMMIFPSKFLPLCSMNTQIMWQQRYDHNLWTTMSDGWIDMISVFLCQHVGSHMLKSHMMETWLNHHRYLPECKELMMKQTINMIKMKRQLNQLQKYSMSGFSSGSKEDVLKSFRSPIVFSNLFSMCCSQVPSADMDLTPFEICQYVDQLWNQLQQDQLIRGASLMFHILYCDWMSCRNLIQYRFGSRHLEFLSRHIIRTLLRCRVEAGEAVGLLGAQNLGEPATQLSLKAVHYGGGFANESQGADRIEQMVDGVFSHASMDVVLKPEIQQKLHAMMFGISLIKSRLIDIMNPFNHGYSYQFSLYSLHLNISLSKRNCIERLISLRKVVLVLSRYTGLTLDSFCVPFMDEPDESKWNLGIRIPYASKYWQMHIDNMKRISNVSIQVSEHQDEQNQVLTNVIAENICHQLLYQWVIHGNPKLENFYLYQHHFNEYQIDKQTGARQKSYRWIIRVYGSDLSTIMSLPAVDTHLTITSDVNEICRVLGIMAARQALQNEFLHVLRTSMDHRHIKLVSHIMTAGMDVQGFKLKQTGQSIPALQRIAFEQCMKQMIEACSIAEKDHCDTICGALIANKILNLGTGYQIKVLADTRVAPKIKSRLIQAQEQKLQSRNRLVHYVPVLWPKGCRMIWTFGKWKPPPSPSSYLSLSFDSDNNNNNNNNDHKDVFQKFMTMTDVISHQVWQPTLLLDDWPDHFFAGTVMDVIVSPSKDVITIMDIYMCCGNNCSVLRWDQRFQIQKQLITQMSRMMPASKIPWRLENMKLYVHSQDASKLTVPISISPYYGLLFYHRGLPAHPWGMQTHAIFQWQLPSNNIWSSHLLLPVFVDILSEHVTNNNMPTLQISHQYNTDHPQYEWINRYRSGNYIRGNLNAYLLYIYDCYGSLVPFSIGYMDRKSHFVRGTYMVEWTSIYDDSPESEQVWMIKNENHHTEDHIKIKPMYLHMIISTIQAHQDNIQFSDLQKLPFFT